MKLFFILAMATSSVMLLVQGAPQITSEQLGKAVMELQEMIKSELQAAEAKSAYANSQQWAKSEWGYPHQGELNTKIQQIREQLKATAQVRGVQIQNCPNVNFIGGILNAALSAYRDQFGVLVDCKSSANCVTVQVDAPADNLITKVDVCDRPNKSPCVEVKVRATKTCTGIIPIPIPIPLPNGDQVSVTIKIDPPIPSFLPGILPDIPACVNVDVNAPKC